MTRRVEEGDGAAAHLNGVSADVLRDAAGLAGDDVGVSDVVEQGGLAVVNVTHDHHDGGAGLELLGLILMVVDQALLHGDDDFLLHLAAELHRDDGRGVVINDLRHRGEDAELHELLDDLGSGLLHARGQLAHGDLVGDFHLELLLARDLQLQLLHLVALLLTALGGGSLLALLVLTADLFLLAAGEIVVAAAADVFRAGHIFKLFVVLLDVDSSAAAGIHHALLRHLTRRMGLVGLLLPGLLLGSRSALRLLLLGRLWGFDALGGLLRLFLLRGLGRRLLLLRGLTDRSLENLLQTLHLVVLCHILEDNVQLVILQHLRGAFGRREIIREDFHNILGRHVKILRYLTNSILNQAHPFVLLFPFHLFLSLAVSPFRRTALEKRRASSSAVSP